MAKKTNKAPRRTMTSQEPNPFASGYAARLTGQVSQELTSARQASMLRKKKLRSLGK